MHGHTVPSTHKFTLARVQLASNSQLLALEWIQILMCVPHPPMVREKKGGGEGEGEEGRVAHVS